jgi:hypothetical protein
MTHPTADPFTLCNACDANTANPSDPASNCDECRTELAGAHAAAEMERARQTFDAGRGTPFTMALEQLGADGEDQTRRLPSAPEDGHATCKCGARYRICRVMKCPACVARDAAWHPVSARSRTPRRSTLFAFVGTF